MSSFFFLWGALLVGLGSCDYLSCPTLTCDTKIGDTVCFQADDDQPLEYLYGQSCEDDQLLNGTLTGQVICEFNLLSQEFAWVNESIQGVNYSTSYNQSELYKKKLKGNCKVIDSQLQMLNNGRDCSESFQCVSKNCDSETSTCVGLEQSEYCHENSDCDSQLFCDKLATWPFTSKCSKLKTSYESCLDTYECSISHYCWFASEDDARSNEKKCLPLYSQSDYTNLGWFSVNLTHPTYQDYVMNGMYCKSGFAFPNLTASNFTGVCMTVDKVIFDDQEIQNPYPCNPTDNSKKCQMFYNVSEFDPNRPAVTQSFEVSCSCALDGNSGYCSSVIGTIQYGNATSLVQSLLTNSLCHTLDRFNFRAQHDICGGASEDLWERTVETNFNMTYWPYIQNNETYSCISSFFNDSPQNLKKQMAAGLQLSFLLLTLLQTL